MHLYQIKCCFYTQNGCKYYTAGFDINVIVLLFRFPTLIVPVLIIAWIKFTSSVWLIGNSGTVVRGTARPGTRETPASLKA